MHDVKHIHITECVRALLAILVPTFSVVCGADVARAMYENVKNSQIKHRVGPKAKKKTILFSLLLETNLILLIQTVAHHPKLISKIIDSRKISKEN